MNPNSGVQHFPKTQKTEDQYARERKAVMSNTPEGRAAERKGNDAHAVYRKLTKEANGANKAYVEKHRDERKKFDIVFPVGGNGGNVEMGNFYRNNRDGLLPKQHATFVEPAAERSTATLTMANQRDRMLKENPYHYRNLQQVQVHEGLRDRAFNNTNVARQQFDTHYDFAGDPTSSKRDQYGQRMPKSS